MVTIAQFRQFLTERGACQHAKKYLTDRWYYLDPSEDIAGDLRILFDLADGVDDGLRRSMSAWIPWLAVELGVAPVERVRDLVTVKTGDSPTDYVVRRARRQVACFCGAHPTLTGTAEEDYMLAGITYEDLRQFFPFESLMAALEKTING